MKVLVGSDNGQPLSESQIQEIKTLLVGPGVEVIFLEPEEWCKIHEEAAKRIPEEKTAYYQYSILDIPRDIFIPLPTDPPPIHAPPQPPLPADRRPPAPKNPNFIPAVFRQRHRAKETRRNKSYWIKEDQK